MHPAVEHQLTKQPNEVGLCSFSTFPLHRDQIFFGTMLVLKVSII